MQARHKARSRVLVSVVLLSGMLSAEPALAYHFIRGDASQDGIVDILVKFDGDALYCLSTDAPYNPDLAIWPKSLRDLLNRAVVPINPE